MQNKEYPKLLNCPFCGSEAHLAELTGSHLPRPLYYGFCTNGHCQTRMVERRSKQKAIEAWNRRPSEVVKVETNFYEHEETYPDCTVQVLTNTKTGKVSVGVWKNEV